MATNQPQQGIGWDEYNQGSATGWAYDNHPLIGIPTVEPVSRITYAKPLSDVAGVDLPHPGHNLKLTGPVRLKIDDGHELRSAFRFVSAFEERGRVSAIKETPDLPKKILAELRKQADQPVAPTGRLRYLIENREIPFRSEQHQNAQSVVRIPGKSKYSGRTLELLEAIEVLTNYWGGAQTLDELGVYAVIPYEAISSQLRVLSGFLDASVPNWWLSHWSHLDAQYAAFGDQGTYNATVSATYQRIRDSLNLGTGNSGPPMTRDAAIFNLMTLPTRYGIQGAEFYLDVEFALVFFLENNRYPSPQEYSDNRDSDARFAQVAAESPAFGAPPSMRSRNILEQREQKEAQASLLRNRVDMPENLRQDINKYRNHGLIDGYRAPEYGDLPDFVQTTIQDIGKELHISPELELQLRILGNGATNEAHYRTAVQSHMRNYGKIRQFGRADFMDTVFSDPENLEFFYTASKAYESNPAARDLIDTLVMHGHHTEILRQRLLDHGVRADDLSSHTYMDELKAQEISDADTLNLAHLYFNTQATVIDAKRSALANTQASVLDAERQLTALLELHSEVSDDVSVAESISGYVKTIQDGFLNAPPGFNKQNFGTWADNVRNKITYLETIAERFDEKMEVDVDTMDVDAPQTVKGAIDRLINETADFLSTAVEKRSELEEIFHTLSENFPNTEFVHEIEATADSINSVPDPYMESIPEESLEKILKTRFEMLRESRVPIVVRTIPGLPELHAYREVFLHRNPGVFFMKMQDFSASVIEKYRNRTAETIPNPSPLPKWHTRHLNIPQHFSVNLINRYLNSEFEISDAEFAVSDGKDFPNSNLARLVIGIAKVEELNVGRYMATLITLFTIRDVCESISGYDVDFLRRTSSRLIDKNLKLALINHALFVMEADTDAFPTFAESIFFVHPLT